MAVLPCLIQASDAAEANAAVLRAGRGFVAGHAAQLLAADLHAVAARAGGAFAQWVAAQQARRVPVQVQQALVSCQFKGFVTDYALPTSPGSVLAVCLTVLGGTAREHSVF